jgi:signal transduction histidine kinase
MRWIAGACAALLSVVIGTAIANETRGTAEEAQAMVARAIAAYDAEGTAAFAAMNPPSTDFRDRDLYVFVFGPDDRNVVHGLDAGRIGTNAAQMVDSTGKAFGKEMMQKANEQGVWIDYVWRDPLTGKESAKKSWIVRHDSYIFGCGIYKP